MSRVIQVGAFRAGIPPLRNRDAPIQLFYDETNNIRKLTLSELGLNVPENKAFVIAGVALRPGQDITEWAQLRQALQMQPNAGEIKFKHVAWGSYPDVLGSRKLATLLQWLLDHDIMVHYSAMDPLYWSILDIIESMMSDARFGITLVHAELKSELHHAVSQDLPAFLDLMHGFKYPDVPREEVSRFLRGVLDHVEARVPRDRNIATTMLKQLLCQAAGMQDLELVFLHDNAPGALIDDFSSNFIHRTFIFKNASHVFDRETTIEKILQGIELRDGERQLDYRFAESEAEAGIQLSDVVAGLVGRHFCHVQDYSLPQLMRQKAGFSKAQLGNLHRLRALIDRSDEFSEGMFHAVMPMDTQFKNEAFLHDQVVPSFMHERSCI